jgi:hypothetical protein
MSVDEAVGAGTYVGGSFADERMEDKAKRLARRAAVDASMQPAAQQPKSKWELHEEWWATRFKQVDEKEKADKRQHEADVAAWNARQEQDREARKIARAKQAQFALHESMIDDAFRSLTDAEKARAWKVIADRKLTNGGSGERGKHNRDGSA